MPAADPPTYGHHAQNDRWIAEAVFPGVAGGWFVEAGACGGMEGSASLALERDLGWDGICVEPAERYFAVLRDHRRCRCDDRCLAARTGEVVSFLYFPDHLARSGMEASNKNVTWAQARGLDAETTLKETVTLSDLLDQHDAPDTVHYLCLDVEGAEAEILGAYDFAAGRPILAISVEGTRCDDLLLGNGYVRVRNPFAPDDVDRYFVVPSVADRLGDLVIG